MSTVEVAITPDVSFFCMLYKSVLIIDVDHIAQVRAVFQLTPPPHSKDKLPDFLTTPLLYIQPFDITTDPDNQPHTQMWMLERAFDSIPGQLASTSRVGLVILLTEVTQAVDLVPVFGESVDHSTTATTSQEVYNHFYFNYYADEESFSMLYNFMYMDYEDANDNV